MFFIKINIPFFYLLRILQSKISAVIFAEKKQIAV